MTAAAVVRDFGKRVRVRVAAILGVVWAATGPLAAAAGRERWEAADLMPVARLDVAAHPPVELVREGEPRGVVHLAVAEPTANLRRMVDELVAAVKLSTGATLDIVADPPAADQPAVVIGDCAASRAIGIVAGDLPVDGFEVRTAANRVFLVGSTRPVVSNRGTNEAIANDGAAWAVSDFLERFGGVRWYFPTEFGGRTVERSADLLVPPSHYRDAPVFAKRSHYPSDAYAAPWKSLWFAKEPLRLPPFLEGRDRIDMQPLIAGLRGGTSWPWLIKVHHPQGFRHHRSAAWFEEHAAMFAVKKDGSRSREMLCYSSPATFAYIMEGCEATWDKGEPIGHRPWVTERTLSISPGDEQIDCHCPACRALFDQDAPWYASTGGSASRIVGTFVKRACEEVARRWPDKKVVYLPYWNYALCPEEIAFPDNLEIEMATTGMAGMRDERVREGIDRNLRLWSAKAGGRITTWEYSCWVLDWTHAPLQFPHIVQDYYRRNRDVLAGSFVNGGQFGEWGRAAPTLYVWMRVLWNPDIDVDATLDEMCRRLYGPAADTCRELLQLMCDRWERAEWRERLGGAGRMPPAVFRDTWPPAVVERMTALRDKAARELADDAEARRRFEWWLWTFDLFRAEAEATNGGR